MERGEGGGPDPQTWVLRPGKAETSLDRLTQACTSLQAGLVGCQASQKDSPGSAAELGSPTEADEQDQEAEEAQEDVQLRLL